MKVVVEDEKLSVSRHGADSHRLYKDRPPEKHGIEVLFGGRAILYTALVLATMVLLSSYEKLFPLSMMGTKSVTYINGEEFICSHRYNAASNRHISYSLIEAMYSRV